MKLELKPLSPCDFNEMQCCSHALTMMGGLIISVNYYLSGVCVLGCCVYVYGMQLGYYVCVCVCVCVWDNTL